MNYVNYVLILSFLSDLSSFQQMFSVWRRDLNNDKKKTTLTNDNWPIEKLKSWHSSLPSYQILARDSTRNFSDVLNPTWFHIKIQFLITGMNFLYHFSTLHWFGVGNRTISSFFGIIDFDLQNEKVLGAIPRLSALPRQTSRPELSLACSALRGSRLLWEDKVKLHLSAETSRPSFSSRESSFDSSASLSPMSFTWVCPVGLVSLVLLYYWY